VPSITQEDVTVAYTALDARRRIKDITYDLLVLDIALPERPELPTSAEAGLELLREICERPSFNKPKQIVGLTAYPDAFERAAPLFERELWLVIHYDASSVEWSEQLERKVRYLLLSELNRQVIEYRCDLCILTALPSPEFSAVLDLPWNWQLLNLDSDVVIFHEGSFERNGSQHRVIAGCAPREGMTAAAVLATKMIQTFRPRYLAMTGIAAGLRGVANAGDILVGDPVWDYGSGKWAVRGSEEVFEVAPHQIPLNTALRVRLQHMSSQPDLLEQIRTKWRGPRPQTALRMIIGPIGSGSAVRADTRAGSDVRAQHRKAVGIEMEAYGVMAAAYDAPVPEVRAFVMKSVCDFADHTKSDEHQAYAAYTSAAALQTFAERFLPL
jgi:nucleoside phosphorylase/CheY-like chemotaxis protein